MKKNITIILFVYILILNIMFFVLPKENYNEKENRYNSDFPTFTFRNLKSGNYTKEIESYINDYFPLRNLFIMSKTNLDLLLLKEEVNNVFIKDNYLISKDNVKLENINKSILKLNTFNKNITSPISFILIPNNVYINRNLLSSYAPINNQELFKNFIFKKLENVVIVDVFNTLLEENNKRNLYYKTDHHYNIFGAFAVYKKYCEYMEIKCVDIENYKIKTVNNFKGSMYSKSGYFNHPGEIFYYIEDNDAGNVLYDYSNNTRLYFKENLVKKDKYKYFLGDNTRLVTIENKNALYDKKIMLIKNSYGNSVVPFLVDTYSNVHVVDIRYFKESLKDYVEKENIEEIIYLVDVAYLNQY